MIDIRLMKLVNGDELITEVVSQLDDDYLILNPLKVNAKVIQQSDGTLSETIYFTHWMKASMENEFMVRGSHVISTGSVNTAVAAYYVSLIDSLSESDKPNNNDDPDPAEAGVDTYH